MILTMRGTWILWKKMRVYAEVIGLKFRLMDERIKIRDARCVDVSRSCITA